MCVGGGAGGGGGFLSKKIFFLFFSAEFELLMLHNNIVKISEKMNKWNLLKIWLQMTYLTDFCMIWLHFYKGVGWGWKVKIFDFF